MAVLKRYGKWYVRFEFRGQEVYMPTEAKNKSEAETIEVTMKKALRTNDFEGLDQHSKTLLIRHFENKELEVPEALREKVSSPPPVQSDELTLRDAARIACSYSETQSKDAKYKERFGESIAHLLLNLNGDTLIQSIKVSDIKDYMKNRTDQGAAAATINRERSTLSRIFRILMEKELVHRNPVSFTKPLDERRGRRKAYVGYADFMKIVAALPDWYRPMALMAYYTGMRQGEVRNLKRSSVFLNQRVMRLDCPSVKERNWKTVPIHRDLVPILKQVLNADVVGIDRVFLRNGRPIPRTEMRRLWEKAVHEAGVDGLHFHDLRHTWKTNARQSGIDLELREKLMGHSGRLGSTHDGYGFEFDHEYVNAIDKLTFDHGETTIWAEERAKICRILPNLKKARTA